VNGGDVRGNTALHYAALNGYVASAEILLESDETLVNSANAKGNTPLHVVAGRSGGADAAVAIVKLLLYKGADREALNKAKLTPLDIATDPRVEEALTNTFDSDLLGCEKLDHHDTLPLVSPSPENSEKIASEIANAIDTIVV